MSAAACTSYVMSSVELLRFKSSEFFVARVSLGTQSPKPFPGTFLPENLENFQPNHL